MESNQRLIAGVLGVVFMVAGFAIFPIPSHSSLKLIGIITIWVIGLVLASAAMWRAPHEA